MANPVEPLIKQPEQPSILELASVVHQAAQALLTSVWCVRTCQDFQTRGVSVLDNLGEAIGAMTDLLAASPRYWSAEAVVTCNGYAPCENTPVLIVHVAWRTWWLAFFAASDQITARPFESDSTPNNLPPFSDIEALVAAALRRLPPFDEREWEIRLNQEWSAFRRRPPAIDLDTAMNLTTPPSSLAHGVRLEEWMQAVKLLPERWAYLSREERLQALRQSDLDAQPTSCLVVPRWDGVKLWFGKIELRSYQRRAAPEQAAILAALEKAGWPSGPVALSNCETLHITINRINDKIKNHIIQLQAAGDGKSVIWSKCKEV